MSNHTEYYKHDKNERQWTPLAPVSSLATIGWSKASAKERKRKGTMKRKRVVKHDVDSKLDQRRKKCKRKKGYSNDVLNLVKMVQHPSLVDVGDGHIWDAVNGQLTIDGSRDHFPCLEGTAKVIVESGKISLLGYKLNERSEAIIMGPSWSNSVPVKAIGNAVVNVQSIANHKKPTVSSFSSAPNPVIISQRWQSACDRVLGVDEDGTPIDGVGVSVASTKSCSRTVICGAKSTGKSTLLRYLVNRHLSHCKSVFVLDCDVGQPELSPPGMLTLTLVQQPLLSPPHLHMTHDHLKAHFYGHVTSRNDPTTYVEMISDLMSVYQERMVNKSNDEEISLIVNTDGWVKGFGFEMISTAIERFQPTFVIQLVADSPSKTFSLDPVLPQESTLLQVEAYESQAAEIPAQALRSLRLSTYFFEDNTIWDRADFGAMGIVDHTCEIANTLAARRPYVVSMNSVRCEVPFVTSSNSMLDALNGSVVGLGVDIKGERYPSCLGLGIIRSIDQEQMLLYILSPVPPDKIVHVDVVVKGTLELPVECVYRGIHADALPYMACKRKVDSVGGEIMKSRHSIGRQNR